MTMALGTVWSGFNGEPSADKATSLGGFFVPFLSWSLFINNPSWSTFSVGQFFELVILIEQSWTQFLRMEQMFSSCEVKQKKTKVDLDKASTISLNKARFKAPISEKSQLLGAKTVAEHLVHGQKHVSHRCFGLSWPRKRKILPSSPEVNSLINILQVEMMRNPGFWFFEISQVATSPFCGKPPLRTLRAVLDCNSMPLYLGEQHRRSAFPRWFGHPELHFSKNASKSESGGIQNGQSPNKPLARKPHINSDGFCTSWCCNSECPYIWLWQKHIFWANQFVFFNPPIDASIHHWTLSRVADPRFRPCLWSSNSPPKAVNP